MSVLVADGERPREGGVDRKVVDVAVGVLIQPNGDFLLTSRPAGKVYEGYEPLKPENIADAALYICSAPAHVNITNMIIYPTAQRSAYVWDRK